MNKIHHHITDGIKTITNKPFPHDAPVSKQRNEDEARVDDFIQIIVFCPPEPRVGARMRERSMV